MLPITPQECSRIAQDLQIRKVQVESAVQLLDEGNTVPFITRYRKERTGGLHEELIRQIQTRIAFLRSLHDRKQTILKTIANQGKLTDELRQAIGAADTTKRLEDLYLPYKPKKRSLASGAREKGLEPLAHAIWYSDPAASNLDELLPALINPEKELKTVDDVKTGVGHILAEMMAESAEVRAPVRAVLWETGNIQSTKNEKLPEGQGNEFKNYFQFKESVRQIPPHRILALNRGEKEHAVKVAFEWIRDPINEVSLRGLGELLLKRAGQMPPPPPPTPMPAPAAAAVTEAPAPAEASPPVDTPPEMPMAAEMASPSTEAPSPPEPMPAAETVVVTDAPPTPPVVEAAVPPHEAAAPAASAAELVAPLVASMPVASAPPTLTGEPLSPASEFKSPHTAFLKTVLEDALNRLLLPSLEREIRNELTDEAEHHAVQVFARNLRSLLLQPPLRGKRVLAIDPGFRTGCKVAALDEYGNLLEHAVIHPFSPPSKKKGRRNGRGDRGDLGDRGDRSSEPAHAPRPAASAVAAPAEAAPEHSPLEHSPAAETPAIDPTPESLSPTPPSVPEPPSEPHPASDTPPPPLNPETSPPELPPAPPEQPITPSIPETPPVETPAAPVPPVPSEPEPPLVDPKIEAKAKLLDLIRKHNLQVIALGNGTGCRETEEIIADLISASASDVAYIIVNEAGASFYSVSPVGREEFPNLDSTTRGTISIGRRLQDPLSELVKVDPQNIGVGLYQHDMSGKSLKDSLDGVVESCVNQVGVDLNTASVPLLRHVSGLNQLVARELVEYRTKNGAFTSREQLMQVSSFGPARFMQAAGFLKIPAAANVFDRTWIHPESYGIAEKLLAELGTTSAVIDDAAAREDFHAKLRSVNIDETARKLGVGGPTLYDIVQALLRPGRDPRDEMPPPIFKKGILRLEDLQPGMELRGTVLNVVDFGAFVDIGLKDSGLVHISQMANRYIKSPYDVVAVNDVVTVWVKSIDAATRHVSLTMIKPGTEQKPPERRPGGGRPQGGDRGPNDRGPGDRGPGGRRPPRGGPRRDGPPQGPGGPGGPQGAPGGEQRPPQRDSRGPGGPSRGPGGPPRGPGGPRPPRQYGDRPQQPSAQGPPPPPPRPRREPPKPKLSKEALEGKAPLRTFGELSALFAAKRDDKKPEPPKAETPPPAPPEVPPASPVAEAPPPSVEPKPETPPNAG